jgi:hypothetical protein
MYSQRGRVVEVEVRLKRAGQSIINVFKGITGRVKEEKGGGGRGIKK